MEKQKVLFICTYHGARSLIAEKFVDLNATGKIEAYSACFEPGKIGPLPIFVMQEIGIELPTQSPKSVFERYKDKEYYDYVISLCNEATTEQCPIFKSNVDALYGKEAKRISWSIADFKSLAGTEEEKMIAARQIREKIESEVIAFLARYRQ
jgi:arsenate reductase (thioredoxin)